MERNNDVYFWLYVFYVLDLLQMNIHVLYYEVLLSFLLNKNMNAGTILEERISFVEMPYVYTDLVP